MKAGQGFQKEFERFCADYEEETQEMLVLTDEHVGGASSWEKGIWRPSAEFLASVNPADGSLSKEKGRLSWLAEEKDKGIWIFDLKPLTIYRVKCRRIKEEKKPQNVSAGWENLYLLVEVVERELRNELLEEVLEEYKKPVVITDELCGSFELERAYNWFYAKVDWLGTTCRVSLECDDEDGVTAEGALAAFREIYANVEEWDEKFRTFAAQKLTGLANEWQDEDMDEEDDDIDGDGGEESSGSITKESFAKRISISEFTIDADGAYTAYYEDDDMFYGHVILIDGSIEDGMKSADIAG